MNETEIKINDINNYLWSMRPYDCIENIATKGSYMNIEFIFIQKLQRNVF